MFEFIMFELDVSVNFILINALNYYLLSIKKCNMQDLDTFQNYKAAEFSSSYDLSILFTGYNLISRFHLITTYSFLTT